MDDLDSDNSDSEWEEEAETMQMTTLCLFCDENVSPSELFLHCSSSHDFKLSSFLLNYAADAISYIKFVNYVRQMKPSPTELKIIHSNEMWNDDKYMKPFMEDDALLMFDIEDYLSRDQSDINENEIALSEFKYRECLAKVELLQQQLQEATADIEKMRQKAQVFMLSSDSGDAIKKYYDDDGYFSSYAHYSIHQEMLQDTSRTETYRNAIFLNKDMFENKIVLDVGCGTAILSMFCASAGAKKVIGVDESEIIYCAMDIVKENKLDEIVLLQKGRLEELTLPFEKVDIIVSEWMGYFLLFENMIESVIFARDHYLSPGGYMFPNRCTISLAAIIDNEMYEKYINYWNNVYGFKMSCIKGNVMKEVLITTVLKEKICSNPVIIKEFDMSTCCVEDCDFTTQFNLALTKDGQITAIIGYFDCYFDDRLTNKFQLSTSPFSELTHWKQTIFLLPSPISAQKGDFISGRISCRRDKKEHRSMIIILEIGEQKNTYILN
ncbi:protein arginine N-methyltransferase 3-like [Centruroides sculpturatus]|uniref:protein arginine N-methyltransferase 3-like n=1 Tax=Centruroides sculpturatus TaxID=218467 RepID=UPI000C6D9C46|nr:protein arginine N-methyltransferase 3-like [Centruroides sculpturatus]